ncbi:MAG: alpha-L-rhamnosidase N-terminal domain-containing protein, partial [Acutalibacteraceae bacterium]
MKLCHLRTNHMKNPIGIDRSPEFSWRIVSDEKNVIQTAYRITVLDSEKTVYDSGKVISSKQSFIPFEGTLKSCTEYEWKVTVWDNKGNQESESSSFETAFCNTDEISAEWIESPFARNEGQLFTYGIENPAVLFKKSFSLNKAVKKARLYATCYGTYRVEINGKRPDEREFAPEFTPYDKMLYYQTYDITDLLNEGENNIGFTV